MVTCKTLLASPFVVSVTVSLESLRIVLKPDLLLSRCSVREIEVFSLAGAGGVGGICYVDL